jgi:hypothetical protein
MRRSRSVPLDGASLNLLEREDVEIRDLFDQLAQTPGRTVQERVDQGQLAKQLVRHVTTRETALMDVVDAFGDRHGLTDVVDRMDYLTEDRRIVTNRLEQMSDPVPGDALSTGQHFEAVLAELVRLMSSEIEWELASAIPTIRTMTGDEIPHPAAQTAGPAPAHRRSPTPLLTRIIPKRARKQDPPEARGDVDH